MFDGRFDQAARDSSAALSVEVGRDFLVVELGAERFVLPDDRLHLDEVDDALEIGFRADRQLQRHRACAETLVDHLSTQREKSAPMRSILLTKHDARHVVLVGLAPDGFGLRLDAWSPSSTPTAPSSTRSERSTSMVKSTWPGVSMMLMRWSFQNAGRRGGRDRDAALLLLLHPVHGRGAVMDFADLVGLAGVIEDALGRRRLAGVDVGHDADVAVISRCGVVARPWCSSCQTLTIRQRYQR